LGGRATRPSLLAAIAWLIVNGHRVLPEASFENAADNPHS
jgi:hypothetical protein